MIPHTTHANAPCRLGLLAPEIPSVSATFVYRECLALAAQGADVVPISVRAIGDRAVAQEGEALRKRVIVLRDRPLRRACQGLAAAVLSPRRTLRVLSWALRDVCVGRFARQGQRLRVLPQAVEALGAARRLRALDLDHLHVHFANAPATVGMYIARALDVPFSVTAHANDLYVEGSLLREKVRRAKAFRTISQANVTWLAGQIGQSEAARVVVIPCGVAMRPDRRRDARVPRRIMSVGRLIRKKGMDVLLEAMASLDAMDDLTLDVFGDGPEREALTVQARRLGLSERVVFHGAVPNEEIQRALTQASAFVLPCRRAADGDIDGIPVVLMEAMAAGVPVISTALGGIPELIRHDDNGLLAASGCHASLAQSLRALFEDPAATTARVEHGLDTVRERFSLPRVTQSLLGAIGALSEPRKPTKRPVEGRLRTVVISPMRNEERLLPGTLRAMASQTLRPALWILVDDGSTDKTLDIAAAAADAHPWIRVVRRQDRGTRKLGGGVVRAFQEGLGHVDVPYDLIGKLDVDMTFGKSYLDDIVAKFEAEPRLGAASGKVFRPEGDGVVEEFMIDDMVAGQFKLWRRDCFEDIGGLVPEVMWDGIDWHRARQEGWRTQSFADESLRLLHHRLMGSSHKSIWRGRMRWGHGQWFMGSSPLYVLASAMFRMHEKPRVMGGALIGLGYVKSMLLRKPRYEHPGFRKELRRWQRQRLLRLITAGRVR